MQKTAILILAAGISSRMGKPKQILPFKNTTLLGWSLEQAKKSKANNVFCVLGANAKIIEKDISIYNIETIFNPNFNNGLSSSIVAGIDYLKSTDLDTVLIMLADQPNINSDYLNKLIKTSEENPSKIIASNYIDKIGVPAVFPKEYFQQLLNLKADKGAKDFLNNHQSKTIKLKPFNLIDIDTIEDYKKLMLGE